MSHLIKCFLPISTINIHFLSSSYILTQILCHILSRKQRNIVYTTPKIKLIRVCQLHVWLKCFPIRTFFLSLTLGFLTLYYHVSTPVCMCVSNNKYRCRRKSILNSYLFNLLPFRYVCHCFSFSSRCEFFYSHTLRGEGWRVY